MSDPNIEDVEAAVRNRFKETLTDEIIEASMPHIMFAFALGHVCLSVTRPTGDVVIFFDPAEHSLESALQQAGIL